MIDKDFIENIRPYASLVIGVFTGLYISFVIQHIGHVVYDADIFYASAINELEDYVYDTSVAGLLFIPFGYFTGTYIGCWVTKELTAFEKKMAVHITGFVLIAFSTFHMLMFPHPVWLMTSMTCAGFPAIMLHTRHMEHDFMF